MHSPFHKGALVAILLSATSVSVCAAPTHTTESTWQRFKETKYSKITSFETAHLAEITAHHSTLFYPFGGADATFPLLLAPNVTTITIVGLEPVGEVSQPLKETLTAETSQKVDSLWRRSFFITGQMAKQFGREEGVISPIVAQLQKLEARDIKVEAVTIPTNGVKISFVHKDKPKSIMYLRVNLHDEQLSDDVVDYLKDQNLLNVTLLKATSYFPHQKKFSKFRELVVSHSQVVVQDDSGIPYRYMKKNFDTIKLFGPVSKPYGVEFKGHLQPDLVKAYQAQENPALGFCFGYGCRQKPAAMLIATKTVVNESKVEDPAAALEHAKEETLTS